MVAISAAAVLGLGAALIQLLPPSQWSIAVIGGLIGVVISSLPLVYSRLARPRVYPITIALAGRPEVGKTIYANVLQGLLLEAFAAGFKFVAEPKTATSVSDFLRRLSEGKLPEPTKTDGVRLYRGQLSEARPGITGLLLRGRRIFRIEVGDSAGEYWERLSDVGGEASYPWLTESSFFEYAANSDVLLYLFDGSALETDPSDIRKSVDDLLRAIQVMRSHDNYGRVRVKEPRIGVVVSKTDVLTPDQFDVLNDLLSNRREFSIEDSLRRLSGPSITGGFAESLQHLERLLAALDRLAVPHQGFAISSFEAALESRIVDGAPVLERNRRLYLASVSFVQAALRPLYFAIGQTWRT